jgi:hypothetical protein
MAVVCMGCCTGLLYVLTGCLEERRPSLHHPGNCRSTASSTAHESSRTSVVSELVWHGCGTHMPARWQARVIQLDGLCVIWISRGENREEFSSARRGDRACCRACGLLIIKQHARRTYHRADVNCPTSITVPKSLSVPLG